jgi:hypothetical protein
LTKTLLAEWACGRSIERTPTGSTPCRPRVDYYNVERTHTALGGITPMGALADYLHGNHTYGAK